MTSPSLAVDDLVRGTVISSDSDGVWFDVDGTECRMDAADLCHGFALGRGPSPEDFIPGRTVGLRILAKNDPVAVVYTSTSLKELEQWYPIGSTHKLDVVGLGGIDTLYFNLEPGLLLGRAVVNHVHIRDKEVCVGQEVVCSVIGYDGNRVKFLATEFSRD